MEETGKKNSYVSRILAVAALIAAAVVLVAVVSANTGGGGDEKKGKANPSRQANKPKTKAKVYKVEEGDNLTIISQKTGISVERIEALNPDLDPQALQPGQKIKLR